MTEASRYDALVDRIEILYNNHQLPEALELLNVESTGLDAWAAELAHIRACLLSTTGDPDAALRTLQDASSAGAW